MQLQSTTKNDLLNRPLITFINLLSEQGVMTYTPLDERMFITIVPLVILYLIFLQNKL